MSSARKLQAEIDRVLKKVDEGAEEFEAIYAKLQNSSSQKLEEKYAEDLKKCTKRLQRHRDTIKSWQQSSQIKDKRAIDEGRKRIEGFMELFKSCEKEMKTKAYSKEGLEMAAKSRGKKDAPPSWMTKSIKTLKEQAETFQSELDELESKEDAGQDDFERLAMLDCILARNKVHVEKLNEYVGHIAADRISAQLVEDTVKNHIEEYIENCQDEEYYEDESVYDSLIPRSESKDSLKDEAKKYTIATEDTALPITGKVSSKKTKDVARGSNTPTKGKQGGGFNGDPSPSKTSSSTMGTGGKRQPSVPGDSKSSGASRDKGAQHKAKSTPTKSKTKPSGNDRVGGGSAGTSSKGGAASSGAKGWDRARGVAEASQPDSSSQRSPLPFAPGPVYEPPNRTARLQHPQAGQIGRPGGGGDGSVDGGGGAKTPGSLVDLASETMRSHGIPVPTGVGGAGGGMLGGAPSIGGLGGTAPGLGVHPSVPLGSMPPRKGWRGAGESTDPPSASGGARSSTGRKELELLRMSSAHIPSASDSERKKKPYTPPNPVEVPSYFPKEPHAIFSNPAIFDKFETDTLFYIFYYQQGSYQQHLAARELKKQYWRYHKKYYTWFQRHEEPKEITNEYELGTYVYFDYETGWCHRKKPEFVFRYSFLEEGD